MSRGILLEESNLALSTRSSTVEVWSVVFDLTQAHGSLHGRLG
jgi:hypothetical protein